MHVALESYKSCKVHHILAELIQGGLVLETNVDEIDSSGVYLCRFFPTSFKVFFPFQYKKQHKLGGILIYRQTHYQ